VIWKIGYLQQQKFPSCLSEHNKNKNNHIVIFVIVLRSRGKKSRKLVTSFLFTFCEKTKWMSFPKSTTTLLPFTRYILIVMNVTFSFSIERTSHQRDHAMDVSRLDEQESCPYTLHH
jgi:hypothetical protein